MYKHRHTRVGNTNTRLSEGLSQIPTGKGMVTSADYAENVVGREVALMQEWLALHMGRGIRARRFTVASETDSVLDCFINELVDMHCDLEANMDFDRNARKVLVAMGDGLQGNAAGGHTHAPLPLVSACLFACLLVWCPGVVSACCALSSSSLWLLTEIS